MSRGTMLASHAVIPDIRFGNPSDRSIVHDNPPPNDRPSGLPEPGSTPNRPAFSFFLHHRTEILAKGPDSGERYCRPLILSVENRLCAQHPFSGETVAFFNVKPIENLQQYMAPPALQELNTGAKEENAFS